MPYSKSLARKSFDAEIDKMITVIRDTYRNRASLPATKEYVLSCAIMLGTAKLEVYFEDIFNHWILKVNASGLTNAKLPKNLKAAYLGQTFLIAPFKKLIVDNNESEFLDLISGQLNNNLFHLTDDAKNIPALNAKRIVQNRKYPSPDNVKALFKRIGINRIFHILNASAKADLEAALQSYNDFRTNIAHNGIPVGINDRDVIDKLISIKNIIYHIDKTLFKYLNAHTTLACWTA